MPIGKTDAKYSEISNKLSGCLKNQGYQVSQDVQLQGKSGIETYIRYAGPG